MPAPPGVSDVLFRHCQGVIHFDAQISDGAFDLGVPEQKLDRSEVSRAPIDQGRFGASQARILAGSNAFLRTTAACEQELAGLLVGGPQIFI
jgi:hypothetical protein